MSSENNILTPATQEVIEEMFNEATNARLNSHADYSNTPIGVAILTKDGVITTGFKVEHLNQSLNVCGEKVAITTLLTKGYSPIDISKILIVNDFNSPPSLCGSCREFMSGFINDNVEIILMSKNGNAIKTSINKLLPC